MKKISFLALMFISTISYSQEIPKLTLTNTGVTPIVINIDSVSARNLYKRTHEWVNQYYNKPWSVIKTDTYNEKIRLTAYEAKAYCQSGLFGRKDFFDIDYSLDIDFKDNKIRLTYTIEDVIVSSTSKIMFPFTQYFESNGEAKTKYKDVKPSLEKSMNDLVLNLYNYIQKSKASW